MLLNGRKKPNNVNSEDSRNSSKCPILYKVGIIHQKDELGHSTYSISFEMNVHEEHY